MKAEMQIEVENLNEIKKRVTPENINLFMDEYGRSLLIEAIVDAPEVIPFLLENGIDINLFDRNG